MDIVYILGSGSKWQDNELRYSLRSLEKHFPHGKVFIVGERPDWLQNIIHIPVPDMFANVHGGRYKNVMKKTLTACTDDRVSDSFVLMNDDFFFLQDMFDIPAYTLGTLDAMIQDFEERYGNKNNSNQYINALLRTKRFLKQKGINNPASYAVHYPIVYEKKKFLQMIDEIEWLEKPCSWRTIYGNLFNIGNIERKDTKVGTIESLLENVDADFISTGDHISTDPQFQKWIDERFPDPSRYEITN